MKTLSNHPDLPVHKLTPCQTENPGLVFYELFDYASLPMIKDHLWQWLKLTVTGGYNKKYFDYRQRESIAPSTSILKN